MSGNTWEDRIALDHRRGRVERLEILWRIQAPTSGRVWECVVYAVETGFELCVQREGNDQDVLQTHLFREIGDELEVMVEAWRAAAIAKGFVGIRIECTRHRLSVPRGKRAEV